MSPPGNANIYNLLLRQHSCTRYFFCVAVDEVLFYGITDPKKKPEIGGETRVQVKLGGDGARFSHTLSFPGTAKNVLSGHGK